MNCSNCGSSLTDEAFCPDCGTPTNLVAETSTYVSPTPSQPPLQVAYTVPAEIKKWNWGAFSFSIFWGIGNKSYLPLLCFIPYFNLIWIFVCGAKGNEWAWKANNYRPEDIHKFLAIQDSWNRGGIAKFIFGIISFFIAVAIMIFVFIGLAALGNYYY